MSTPLPRGIERDETVHGRLYYTRAQLMAFGQARVDEALQNERGASRTRSSPHGAAPRSAAVDDLMSKMGVF